MAGESVKYTDAAAFQDYIREFEDTLYSRMFFGFKTGQIATPHEGVKGELVLTTLQLADNLARRWKKTFDPVADAINHKPRKLKVAPNKIDFSIVPQEYESTYLGRLRQRGQKVDDWPFQDYILGEVMKKLNQEFEVAIWKGKEKAVPADGDYLRETFDGFLTLIVAAITAGDLTPVATGAITASNAVEKFRLLWEEVEEAYKENGTDIFCSYTTYDNYRKNYKTLFGQHPNEVVINNTTYSVLPYELGGGQSMIIATPGLAGSGRVVITPREYLHYGMDSFADTTMFEVEQEVRELRFWMDFKMGAQMLFLNDGIVVVNDQE